ATKPHLAQLVGAGQTLAHGVGDAGVDPALDQGEQGLEPASAASVAVGTLGPVASAAPESIPWSLAGSCSIDGSRLEAKSSSPEVSTRMPRAYSSTVASTRARSHGAPANRRR